MVSIVVNQEPCTRCGACIALCTGRVFERVDERVEAAVPEKCWLCGHCVAACPVDAIQHSAYPVSACPALDPDTLPSLDGLVAALRARRSARVFRDLPVPRQVVRELIDLARWGPSASNEQPVDWVALDDPARIGALSAQAVAVLAQTARLLRNPLLRPFLRLALGAERVNKGLESADSFERLAQRAAQGEDPIFFQAPVVLIAHVPADAYFGRDDAVYAAYNLMLGAQRLGLGTCHIGYFSVALDRSHELRRALGLPEDRRAEVTLVLGYPKYRFRRAPTRRQPELVWNPAASPQ
jgi:nitroreductase/NAD-dependent dihydropyrimidine dehydrogenase PreA subunit